MAVDHRDNVVLEDVEELLGDVVKAERVLEGKVEPGLAEAEIHLITILKVLLQIFCS